MIESIDLYISLKNGTEINLPLTPTQAGVVIKILGIQSNSIDSYSCFSDETLQAFMEFKGNPLKLDKKTP